MFSNIVNALCGLETGNNLSFLVNQEFGEVPLDIGLLLVVWVSFAQHVVQNWSDGVVHIPTCKPLLLLQELIQWLGILAVYLYFLKAWEFGAEGQFAELMDAFVRSRSLLSKLVAGEVENFEALAMILLVKLL